MRSMTGRREGSSREYSMKPVVLPMLHLPHSRRDHGDGDHGRDVRAFGARNTENALVLVRENLDETRQELGEICQDFFRPGTGGGLEVTVDDGAQERGIGGIEDGLQINAGEIAAARGEVTFLVEDVGDATVHAGGEVAPALAEYDDEAFGHVLATVVA